MAGELSSTKNSPSSSDHAPAPNSFAARMSSLETSWNAAKELIQSFVYSNTSATAATEAVIDITQETEPQLVPDDGLPGQTNHRDSGISPKITDIIARWKSSHCDHEFEEGYLVRQLREALFPLEQVPIETPSLTKNKPHPIFDDLSAGLNAECFIQNDEHSHPSRSCEYFRRLKSNFDLVSDGQTDQDGYRSTLDLFDELRKLEVLPYLVPRDLEGELDHIYRMKSALKDRQHDVARTVAMARYWIHGCWSKHQECLNLSLSSKMWPNLPDRVLDLCDYNPLPFHPPLCLPRSLVKVVQANASRGAYVALSYRWPEDPEKYMMLSSITLNKLSSEGIDSRYLLDEIQDACTLAKGLGIQYLWVDAMCIVQGRGGDWHIQAEKMASIYMNAVVTIAVVDKTSLGVAARERPFVSKAEQLLQCPSPFKEKNQESVYRWLDKSGNFISRPLGELDDRGWAYQELLLSGRIISLTKEGVFWDCLHHSASANRPSGILGDFSPQFIHTHTREFKRFLLNPKASVTSEEYYRLWRKAVQNYTKRKLTKGKDRFIALEGVTRQMSLLLDDECILGIWKKDILRSLLWFAEPPLNRWPRLGVLGPSWSWISVNSPVSYRLWHPYERYLDMKGENLSQRATVSELSAWRKNSYSFDMFRGTLTIIGPVTEGYICKSIIFCHVRKEYVSRSDVYFARRWADRSRLEKKIGIDQNETFRRIRYLYTGDTTDPFYIETALMDYKQSSIQQEGVISVKKVFCLLLLSGGYSNMLSAHYCLILERLAPGAEISRIWEGGEKSEKMSGYTSIPRDFEEIRGTTYRRIGIGAFNTRHICLSSHSICTEEHEDYSDCMGVIQELRIK